jgi:hypothetical protein
MMAALGADAQIFLNGEMMNHLGTSGALRPEPLGHLPALFFGKLEGRFFENRHAIKYSEANQGEMKSPVSSVTAAVLNRSESKKEVPRCFKWVKTRHRRKIWNSRTQEKERNRMAASNLKSLAPWKWV